MVALAALKMSLQQKYNFQMCIWYIDVRMLVHVRLSYELVLGSSE